MTEPTVEVFDDADALAAAVARRFLALVSAPVDPGRGVHEIGLTGGGIADRIHREIGRRDASDEVDVDWSRVRFWWGDERFVAPDSPDRNVGQARAAFLDGLAIAPDHIVEVPALGSVTDAGAAAERYADLIRSQVSGDFDVMMLGVGPDGHVASLFPGHPVLDVTGQVTTYVLDSPKPPPERVTLTFEALNRSREVWFLAAGEEKAAAVAAALAPGDLHDTPARGVRGTRSTTFFLDRAAASALS